MELALVLALGVPLGRYVANRNFAFALLAAAFLVVLRIQTAQVPDAGELTSGYWPAQVIIAALGAWLVAVGSCRRPRVAQVDLDHVAS
jgi:hypothetical protein